MKKTVPVNIEGKVLKLTNIEKVLFPGTGMTKGEVIDYYSRIAPVLLPHIRNRTISLKRYPDGVQGEYFFEKQCPSYHPPWVNTVTDRKSRKKPDFCVVTDLSTLIWIINLASLELHTYLYRVDNDQRPTMVVFDLDPGPPAGLQEAGRVALMLHELFSDMGMACYAKMTGGKGIHLAIPVNYEATEFENTKLFARSVAEIMEREYPELILSSMAKKLRAGKVFIDWSQNDHHKTTLTVYSLRVRDIPKVSVPVSWDELARAVETATMEDLLFSPAQVLERVARDGDLFGEVATRIQPLPALSRPAPSLMW